MTAKENNRTATLQEALATDSRPAADDPIESARTIARIERAQSILNAQSSTIVELEAVILDQQRLIAACDADVVEIASRRKIEMIAATPAGELDKKLSSLDKREKEVQRHAEIASTVLVALEQRLAEKREAERVAQETARRHELNRRRGEAISSIKSGLSEIGAKTSEVLRVYKAIEAEIAAFNRALAPGEPRIPSIEAARRTIQPRKVVVDETFDAFVGQGIMISASDVGPRRRNQARPIGGGWFEVFISTPTGAGDIHRCELIPCVRVHTEVDATRAPEPLPVALNVPAFDAVRSPPRTYDHRMMKLSEWATLNSEPDEAEPGQPRLAAE